MDIRHRDQWTVVAVVSCVAAVVVAPLVLMPQIRDWSGWQAVSAVSALLASLGIGAVVYQVVLQRKGHSLEQTRFLRDLAPEFERHRSVCAEAYQILHRYPELPKELTWEETGVVSGALRSYYDSVFFVFQLGKLSRFGIVDAELLYLLYHEQIIDAVRLKFSALTKWTHSGLDYASNFDASDVRRTAMEVLTLLKSMADLDVHHGGSGSTITVEEIEKILPTLDDAVANTMSSHWITRYVRASST